MQGRPRDAVERKGTTVPKERVKHGKLYAHYEQDAVGSTSDSPLTDEVSREYLPGDKSIPKNAVITEDPSLDVSWNRDLGWVQVSIDFERRQWVECVESFEDGEIKKAVFTDTLSRQEINHMIRTLRRARDAAFGADE